MAKIYQYDHPPLDDGSYSITVTQEFSNLGAGNEEHPHKLIIDFEVAGEQISLKPAEFYALYPPANSSGRYAQMIPMVVLNRSTLPWERSAQKDAGEGEVKHPWLALICFNEKSEVADSVMINRKSLTLDQVTDPDLKNVLPDNVKEKVLICELTRTSHANDFDYKWGVQVLVPPFDTLSTFAHVREKGEGKQAVILGKPIPPPDPDRPDQQYNMYLISVEGRYDASGKFIRSDPSKNVQFICLKHWRFQDQESGLSFEQKAKQVSYGYLSLPTLEYPKQSATNQFLQSGFVPLKHRMRTGAQSVSWYRSPLLPAPPAQKMKNFVATPVPSADALMLFDRNSGLFDVSYAAAWELGRLLALKSKDFSIGLYSWKRRHAQAWRKIEQEELFPHLPGTQHDPGPESKLPQKLEDWLAGLSRLEGVPFNYLVPDEKLLPADGEGALRIFYLDQLWVRYLLDGAFSIGRVGEADFQKDHKLADLSTVISDQKYGKSIVSGYLLRSELVAAFPGLQIEAFDKKGNLLQSHVEKKHSPSIMMGLYQGGVGELRLSIKEEEIHFMEKSKPISGQLSTAYAQNNVHPLKKVRFIFDPKARNPGIMPPAIQRLIDNLVKVEGGAFTMGWKEGRDGDNDWAKAGENQISQDLRGIASPSHQVTVRDFWMAAYLITAADWNAITGNNPSSYNPDLMSSTAPADVSWDEVQQFIKFLNEQSRPHNKRFRLPTEAEWEYAARGGKKSVGYLYSGTNDVNHFYCNENNRRDTLEDNNIGNFPPNELGLYDMSGLSWEWTEDDWHSGYNGAPVDGSAWQTNPQTSNKVIRGGQFYAVNCRVAARYFQNIHEDDHLSTGLRLVMEELSLS